MDGLAVCSLKASAVEGGALSFEDVSPGQLLSGTVDGVRGLRRLCQARSRPQVRPRPSRLLKQDLCC